MNELLFYILNNRSIFFFLAKNIDFLPQTNDQNYNFLDSDFHPYQDNDFNFPIEKQLFEDFEKDIRLNNYEDPQGFVFKVILL